jgi:hypothetical protein
VVDAANEVVLPEIPRSPEPVTDSDAEPEPLIDSACPFASQRQALRDDRDRRRR